MLESSRSNKSYKPEEFETALSNLAELLQLQGAVADARKLRDELDRFVLEQIKPA